MSLAIKNDALLTNFAVKYKQGQMVSDFIAPPFPVKRISDTYAVYGKSLQRVYDNRVSGREKAREIDADATEATYVCEKYKLATFLDDDKKLNSDNPLQYEQVKLAHVLNAQILAREQRIAAIAGSASVVTQTAAIGAAWATAASGTPIANILTGVSAIKAGSQMVANRIMIPDEVALKMIACAEWTDRFKYASSIAGAVFDMVSGLKMYGLEPMRSGAYGCNTQEGGASDPGSENLWSDSVLIFYCEPNPTIETRSFMYSPYVNFKQVQRWRENGEDGEHIQVMERIDELLVDATCGYLMTNCI